MNDIVLPTETEIIASLITKYRGDLAEATKATEEALRELKTRLAQMERNQVAIAAQTALINTLEKDIKAKQV